jgi:amino acid adenylation domain-containing protein
MKLDDFPDQRDTPNPDAARPALCAAERDRVLYEWNRTAADFPDLCTHELFERQAASDPSAIALVFEGETLTYRELNERANQLAHHLRRRGVGPGALVGVSLHRSPRMVIGLLGVWKAGAAYVPLDPTYPAERLAFMADDAAVQVLLGDARAADLFPQLGERRLRLDTDWPAIAGEGRANLASGAQPSDLAYVMYTSGSTGQPKGAQIAHGGLVNYLWWAIRAYGVARGGSVPVHSSISFDLTVTSLYPALLAGGRVELLPEDSGAQSLIAGLRQAKNHSLVKITPAHLKLLTAQIAAPQAKALTRAFVIGGENLTAESLELWRKAAPSTRLINEYGPTETVVGCCIHEVHPDDPHNGSVPIGRPIANTELYVLDDSLQPVAIGATGELYIGGAGVARGYLNRPELTRERFLPDPFSGRPGARLYKTGDLARYRNDGVLEYLGRADDQVKVRGYRIELGEIEATLAGHADVQSCAVLAREDAPGDKQLVGYVVAHKDAAPAADRLRGFLKDRLPDYMVPARFVFLASLPLTQNGKVDRRALPAPTAADRPAAEHFAPPRTATEEALARIWADLLKLEHIGVDDDVFELGASSLMVLGAVARIRVAVGADVPMHILFENPTVAQMAAALDTLAGASPHFGPAEPARSAPPQAAPRPAPAAVAVAASSSPAAAHVIPIRFGAPGRELVGLYQPPSVEADRRAACLLCNPFGQEAVRAHRIYRVLADRLARSGLHVLRFDYAGTGDSSGVDETGDLERWTEDIRLADEELLRRSGSQRRAWFGLRLGASLAALASIDASPPPERLVLWDPVVDGSAYLAELASAHVAARREFLGRRWETDSRLRSIVAEEARAEVLGFPLTPRLLAGLGRLSVSSFVGVRTGSATLLGAHAADAPGALKQALERAGLRVATPVVESDIAWAVNEMLNDAVILPQDIRRIALAISEEP